MNEPESLAQKLIALRDAGLLTEAEYQAKRIALVGDGAAAQGTGAQAVGKGGVLVGGSVGGSIVTGTWNIIVGDPGTDPEKLRAAYLHYLLYTCGQLSLSGIDPRAASEAEASLHLGAVYTALLTRSSQEHDQTPPRRGDPASRPLSALAAFNQHPHLVLLGDPGSGKSTFVNFIALCLAGERLGHQEMNLGLLTAPLPADDEGGEQERPQPWQHGPLLPIRVILRDLAARGLPPVGQKATAAHLWQFIVAELKACTLGQYAPHLHQELQEKGGVLLLDGLDEVPEADERRGQIKAMVTDFAALFPHCRLLVTSRTYAYQKQDWRLPGFAEQLLAPFSRGQIRNFVERWYAHIASLRGLNPTDAQGRAELLKRAIFASDRLQGLAERPLLLTLMASLHAWRGGSLPEKREQLYADTVELLLDWWEKPKLLRDAAGNVTVTQPSLAEWLKVDRDQVRQLLNRLAYTAHAHQTDLRETADITQADLRDGLLNLSQNPDVKPLRLMEYLSQRAGLLVPRGVGVYTFPHRTIQEYLAACHLTDEEFPDKLAELARNDPERWREVTLLAGAKAARGSAAAVWSLAEALCYEDPPANGESSLPDKLWGAQLAGQTLAETADLSRLTPRNQQKLDRTRRWLVHILRHSPLPPLERALAGVSLGQLGDIRPELLHTRAMQFCLVPAGPFWMDLEDGSRDEKQHQLDLPYPYWIGRYPVTNAQFAEFAAAGGYKVHRYWPEAAAAGVWTEAGVQGWAEKVSRQQPYDFGSPYHLPNHPVVGITWFEMLAFTRWLTETWRADPDNLLPPDWQVTLPSEAEWEKAARGGGLLPETPLWVTAGAWADMARTVAAGQPNPDPQRPFPWLGQFSGERANGSSSEIGRPSTPGVFPLGASPYGVEEMSGNVWEWTRSTIQGYPYQSDDGREDVTKVQRYTGLSLRGGAYHSHDEMLRCGSRGRGYPHDGYVNCGFRVCVRPHFPASGL